jgi:hypothetical protein
VTGGQSATPDVASVPWTSKATARLNQPFSFAGRSGWAAATVGAVASYLSP